MYLFNHNMRSITTKKVGFTWLELAILNPAFISQAIGLAKLVETKLQATQTLFPNPLRMPYPKSQSSLATYTTQQINTPYPFLNQVPTPN